jgi:hypothetical protein
MFFGCYRKPIPRLEIWKVVFVMGMGWAGFFTINAFVTRMSLDKVRLDKYSMKLRATGK